MATSDWLEGVRDRLEAFMAGTETVVPTKDATTVVVIRDGKQGLEVFLMERPASMAFAPSAHVFPGGKVDDADYGVIVDLDDAWVAHLTARDVPHAAALVYAGVRETQEEVGVELDHRLVRPWAHWITPPVEARRYDTRFLIAALPEGQVVVESESESAGGRWWQPEELLQEAYADHLILMPPTLATIKELKQYASVADVMAACETRPVARHIPRLTIRDDRVTMLHIGDDGYDEAIH
jgi:8-oxo-dGTP pyrophosphatase MutT (NUDIX family)